MISMECSIFKLLSLVAFAFATARAQPGDGGVAPDPCAAVGPFGQGGLGALRDLLANANPDGPGGGAGLGGAGGGSLAGALAAGVLPAPIATALVNFLTCAVISANGTGIQLGLLFEDNAIIAADLWDEEPKILSGSPGFDGIVGLDLDYNSSLEDVV